LDRISDGKACQGAGRLVNPGDVVRLRWRERVMDQQQPFGARDPVRRDDDVSLMDEDFRGGKLVKERPIEELRYPVRRGWPAGMEQGEQRLERRTGWGAAQAHFRVSARGACSVA